MITSWALFLLMLKASLFSTGGSANLPSLHNDLIPLHWATDKVFAESLLIGQIAPGPSGLWVISLGYLVFGVRGSLLALVAIVLPPMLILVIDRLYRRVEGHPAVEGFIRGMSLSVGGVFAVVLAQMLRAQGIDVFTISVAVGAALVALTGRVPIPVILVLGATAGLLKG